MKRRHGLNWDRYLLHSRLFYSFVTFSLSFINQNHKIAFYFLELFIPWFYHMTGHCFLILVYIFFRFQNNLNVYSKACSNSNKYHINSLLLSKLVKRCFFITSSHNLRKKIFFRRFLFFEAVFCYQPFTFYIWLSSVIHKSFDRGIR